MCIRAMLFLLSFFLFLTVSSSKLVSIASNKNHAHNTNTNHADLVGYLANSFEIWIVKYINSWNISTVYSYNNNWRAFSNEFSGYLVIWIVFFLKRLNFFPINFVCLADGQRFGWVKVLGTWFTWDAKQWTHLDISTAQNKTCRTCTTEVHRATWRERERITKDGQDRDTSDQ